MNYQIINVRRIMSICLTILFLGSIGTSVTHAEDHSFSVNAINTNYKYQTWGQYPLINLFGMKLVPLFDSISPVRKTYVNKLALLLLDSNYTYTLKSGEKLDLGNGYILQIKEINENTNKVWFELDSNEQYIDDALVGSDQTWTVIRDHLQDEDNIPVFKVHVKQIFFGEVDNIVQIDGIWLIDFSNVNQFNIGNQYGNYTLNAIYAGTDASNLGRLVFEYYPTVTNEQTQTTSTKIEPEPSKQPSLYENPLFQGLFTTVVGGYIVYRITERKKSR